MFPLLLAHAPPAPAAEVTRDLPGEAMPDRHFDVLHLDLDVRLDLDAGTVSGTTRHQLARLGRPTDTLRLHQVALEVSAVRVDGATVEGWRLGPETLEIPVPREAERLVVEVDYRARPENGLHFRGQPGTGDPAREVWSQGEGEENRYWFPSWDYPNDKFSVSTRITVPSGMVALGNGVLVGSEPAGAGLTTWTYALERPIANYLVALSAGELVVVEDQGEVPLGYSAPRGTPEDVLRRTLATAKPQMAYFADLLGHPYPYPVYRQALVSRFLYGGMENASLTILADRLRVDRDGDPALGTESVVAHELAHQWFGDLLTCYGWRDLWLNEGFASFYAGRWMETTYGPEHAAATVRGWLTAAAGESAPMAARSWSKVPGRDNAAVYVRGASVLQMMRVWLGDEVFDAGIREYVRRNADRLVESADLRRAMEDVSGTHLGWLFDQYVHGVGVPAVATSWSWAEGELTVVLNQTTEGTPFSAPVEIEVGGGLRTVWLGAGETRLVTPLAERPTFVAVDPRGGVLARWTQVQEPAAWVAQATRSAWPYARVFALEQLGQVDQTEEALAALQAVLADRTRAGATRERAAASLGALRTAEAGAALLAVGGQAKRAASARASEGSESQAKRAASARASEVIELEPRLRGALAQALGQVETTPEVTRALVGLAREDDPWVRGSALPALAEHDVDAALSAARAALSRPDRSPTRAAQVAALGVLGEHGADRDWPAVLRLTSAKEPREVRHAAFGAAAGLADDFEEPEEERRRDGLNEALRALVVDPDLRARQLAISLFARVGGAPEAVRLDAFAQQTSVRSPDLAAQARDAASVIRRRGAADGGPAAEGPDLKALREELAAVEKRLERLEEWR